MIERTIVIKHENCYYGISEKERADTLTSKLYNILIKHPKFPNELSAPKGLKIGKNYGGFIAVKRESGLFMDATSVAEIDSLNIKEKSSKYKITLYPSNNKELTLEEQERIFNQLQN